MNPVTLESMHAHAPRATQPLTTWLALVIALIATSIASRIIGRYEGSLPGDTLLTILGFVDLTIQWLLIWVVVSGIFRAVRRRLTRRSS